MQFCQQGGYKLCKYHIFRRMLLNAKNWCQSETNNSKYVWRNEKGWRTHLQLATVTLLRREMFLSWGGRCFSEITKFLEKCFTKIEDRKTNNACPIIKDVYMPTNMLIKPAKILRIKAKWIKFSFVDWRWWGSSEKIYIECLDYTTWKIRWQKARLPFRMKLTF